jgi:hypothetical protein
MEIGEPKDVREIRPVNEPVPEQRPVSEPIPEPAGRPLEPSGASSGQIPWLIHTGCSDHMSWAGHSP